MTGDLDLIARRLRTCVFDNLDVVALGYPKLECNITPHEEQPGHGVRASIAYEGKPLFIAVGGTTVDPSPWADAVAEFNRDTRAGWAHLTRYRAAEHRTDIATLEEEVTRLRAEADRLESLANSFITNAAL